MKNKKLSVITICYNIKNEIERTCKSIVSQTEQNFEWIVVDGGSTDGTREILNKYKSRIDVFISEPDKGIYDAMNKGIKAAHAEFLNFMNGGDTFSNAHVVEEFLEYDTSFVDILYANINMVNAKGEICLMRYPDEVDKIYFCNQRIGHQAAFIRRDLFKKYGLYDEEYRIVADWEKWIVFAEHNCVFRHWDKVIATFYNIGISSQNDKRHWRECDEVKKVHFTPEEEKTAKQQKYERKHISLMGIPFFLIKRQKYGQTMFLYLFHCIPLYKVKSKNGKIKHSLFGFIPLLEIKS